MSSCLEIEFLPKEKGVNLTFKDGILQYEYIFILNDDTVYKTVIHKYDLHSLLRWMITALIYPNIDDIMTVRNLAIMGKVLDVIYESKIETRTKCSATAGEALFVFLIETYGKVPVQIKVVIDGQIDIIIPQKQQQQHISIRNSVRNSFVTETFSLLPSHF